MKTRYEIIKQSVAHLPKDEAIEDLKERIFIEEMADFMDFEFVRICEAIIKELQNG